MQWRQLVSAAQYLGPSTRNTSRLGVTPQPGAGIIWKHLHIRAWQLILPIGCDLSWDCQQKYLTEASPCGLVFLIEQQLLTGQIF